MTERAESIAAVRGITVAVALMTVVVGVVFAFTPALDGRAVLAPLLILGGGGWLVLVRRSL